MTMKGFGRGAVVLLVGGALGLWGCNSEQPPREQSGFQDPVQSQHRGTEDRASTTVNNRIRNAADPGQGGRPYDSDAAGTGGSGRQLGGATQQLGTGLADSYRGPEGTGGAGLDAGTHTKAPHSGMNHGAPDAGGTDRLDAGLRR
ncbi:hypothetical protein D7Y13_37200 [Corallococcus praedator]|uniref:Lipoprotein n=1 Tax=Corallococcus praedator TaxID=2316724 RepID=A0ABX9Q5S4_9BACT|nr:MULTISPECIES: hypothetical protein [Corallococcus]RKH19548.1 hypothetical protein D7X75_38640 [Corallococcus sp. CA031C]RKH92323.1 hypothetical protein D7Y13_37200 [Corallococcus praedator]